MDTKQCSKCNQNKDINLFALNRKTNRYNSWCQACKKIYDKEYTLRNKDKKAKYDKLYNSRIDIKEKHQRYRQENKEKFRNQQRQWKQNNPHKVKQNSRKDYERRREKVISYMKKYQKRRHVKIKHALTTRIREELKNCLLDKKYKTIVYLGCTIPEFILYLESKFQTGMTWENYGFYGWHIDHIKPCASFDLTDTKQQKKCFHYTNLQPLWATTEIAKENGCMDCIGNFDKHTKII